MLFIRCGTAHFFVGTIDGRARDPKAVKSPLELELSDVCQSKSRSKDTVGYSRRNHGRLSLLLCDFFLNI